MLLYAHRGASAELPENTLPAFVRALELGADVLETDAHVTSDGRVVLSHDETGARMAGVARAIRECSFDDVRSWDVGFGFVDPEGKRPFAGKGFRVPTLEEAWREIPRVRFNVDLKPTDPLEVDRIVRALLVLGAEERTQLVSFHAANLRRARALGWQGKTGLAQTEVARLVVEPLALLRRRPLPGTLAQVPVKLGPVRFDTPAFLAKAHGLGLRVDYWVVNDPDEARRLRALGADGIMTDDPRRVGPAARGAAS